MKKDWIVAVFLSIWTVVSVFAQRSDSGRFMKRIENNYISDLIIELSNGKEEGVYNLESKTRLEKRFFGYFNAKVEYFLDPSFRPVVGLRIYRDSLDRSYLLEVKKMTEKNRESAKIVSRIIPVSDAFANKIYSKTVKTIETFKSVGKPRTIYDGETATFRCVVGDDLWTFTIHMPAGNVRKVSELFQRLIADAEAGTFNEAKYLEELDQI